jgi:hypothetical protein
MKEHLPDMNSIDMLLNISVYVGVMMYNATFNNFSGFGDYYAIVFYGYQ